MNSNVDLMNIQNLNQNAHIHFMGICGTAMASLACLLKEKGFNISGSDTQAYPPMSEQLKKNGITIKLGYQKNNLNPSPDLVIVGNVIRKSYEEAEYLLKTSIPYISLPQAIAKFLIKEKESIVISGTHGKTTTTSLMAWVATYCKISNGFLIGGVAKNFSTSFSGCEGKYFIIEGDEYDTAFFDKVPKFIHYKPKHVIITSIEFDHADIYKDLSEIKESFKKLISLIPGDGTLIYNQEDKNIKDLLSYAKTSNIFSYSNNKSHYYLKKLDDNNFAFYFNPNPSNLKNANLKNEKEIGKFKSNLFGEHNLKNTLAVLALSHQLKWNISNVLQSISQFQGVKRRQEIIGSPQGITIIDDFAHHPTAVKETIKAIRSRFQKNKIFAVYEPRSATARRNFFKKDYIEAFKQVSDVILMQPYNKDDIEEEKQFASYEIVNDLKKKGINAQYFINTEQIINHLTKECKKNDIILIMSNGNFNGIQLKLLNSLKK